jgi:hypothetical protein
VPKCWRAQPVQKRRRPRRVRTGLFPASEYFGFDEPRISGRAPIGARRASRAWLAVCRVCSPWRARPLLETAGGHDGSGWAVRNCGERRRLGSAGRPGTASTVCAVRSAASGRMKPGRTGLSTAPKGGICPKDVSDCYVSNIEQRAAMACPRLCRSTGNPQTCRYLLLAPPGRCLDRSGGASFNRSLSSGIGPRTRHGHHLGLPAHEKDVCSISTQSANCRSAKPRLPRCVPFAQTGVDEPCQ